MGILNNTVSLCQFRVSGTFPAGNLGEWIAGQLDKFGFRGIEQGSEELSVGWVRLDDHQDNRFADGSACQHEHFLAFSLRRDQRKLPAALLKAHQTREEERFLAENPGLQRVPKRKRDDIKDAVRGALLARTLPTPAVWDAVWDTRTHILSFTSLSPKVIELLEAQFKKSFPGLRLVTIHPLARAEQVVPEPLQQALKNANKAGTDAVVDQIRENRWIGTDLLLWLMEQTLNGSAEFTINCPGPGLDQEPFVGYLNDRLILLGQSDNGLQKVTVAGPQDQFQEVRSALQSGKQIHEAVLYLEQNDELWKLTLKGELFQFAAFKSPAVKLENDDLTDPIAERQAVFFERMYLIEKGLQLFDSLFATFLAERLGPHWAGKEQAIREWLAA
jgi:hypothetical protein